MTHLEWGLLMVAAALVLGGLLGGPFWYAAGRDRGQREWQEAWEDELDKSVAWHPAGNGRHAGPDLDAIELPARPVLPYLASPVVFGGYEDLAAAEAARRVRPAVYQPPDWAREAVEQWQARDPDCIGDHGTVLMPSAVLAPEEMSWTGEIAKMTAAFERDMKRLLDGTDEQLKEITR